MCIRDSSGGVRRTSEIGLVDQDDPECIQAKSNLYRQINGRWEIDKSIAHRQMSNNSLLDVYKRQGYVLSLALDEDNEICGYKFVSLGKMMDAIKKGTDPKEAYEKNIGTYGRYEGAAKYIDPRQE